jgi:hypothetical protein
MYADAAVEDAIQPRKNGRFFTLNSAANIKINLQRTASERRSRIEDGKRVLLQCCHTMRACFYCTPGFEALVIRE